MPKGLATGLGAHHRHRRFLGDAMAQEERIDTDGASIESVGWLDDHFRALKRIGLYPNVTGLWDAAVGIKEDGSSRVGKFYDLSGNDNDLSQATDDLKPTSQPGIIHGSHRTSLLFDRSNDELGVSDNAALSVGDNDLFLGAWIAPDSTNPQGIVSKGDPNSAGGEYGLEYNGSEVSFTVRNTGDSASTSATDDGLFYQNEWIFLYGIHDSVNDRLEVGSYRSNGATGVDYSGGILDGTNDFVVGRQASSYFGGDVAVVIAADKIPTKSEIDEYVIFIDESSVTVGTFDSGFSLGFETTI